MMSQRCLRDPEAFERANYLKILHEYRPPDLSTIGHKENSNKMHHNGASRLPGLA
jgi:hypothetical protein